MKRRSSLLPILASCLLSGAVSGCGLVFTKGPPPGHEAMPYFECSENASGPTLDFIMAGLSALAAVGAVRDVEHRGSGQLVGQSLAAVVWAFSGKSGMDKVHACRAARAAAAAKREQPGKR